ncbi:MAG TPA: DUF2760 domain-containing protein [Blastocatellia bacterium]|jgi:hypothetical protein|nr:DUF2760 domain-containing protein [Blastocatellia bacterium]
MIGFGKRISYAFRSFFNLLASGEIPGDIAREVAKEPANARPVPELRAPATAPKSVEPPPADRGDRAVQILSILQRDGRLIDFFTEDISPYSDAQIGAAVRDLQQSCRQSLERYVKLEPVLDTTEGETVTVQEGFDPSTIKLVGSVTGKPPVSGLLRHRGWRVKELSLPPLLDGNARSIIAPAEVEVQG